MLRNFSQLYEEVGNDYEEVLLSKKATDFVRKSHHLTI